MTALVTTKVNALAAARTFGTAAGSPLTAVHLWQIPARFWLKQALFPQELRSAW